jgi:hypothetical protein
MVFYLDEIIIPGMENIIKKETVAGLETGTVYCISIGMIVCW